MRLTITIPGIPIAKKRPRFVRRGKFVGTYNPQETEEGRWLFEAQKQIPQKLSGPVAMNISFMMPIPKSTSDKKKSELLLRPHTKRPDIDNLAKFCMDCLNGVAFDDDCQIWMQTISKRYSAHPMTCITIDSAEEAA